MNHKLLLVVLLSFCALMASSQEICNNGIDDDYDGKIDLLDDDCTCTVYPLIKNPSFEKIWNCPTSYSQLHYANYWMQPNAGNTGSTDLYHSCGDCVYKYTGFIANFPKPIPDGVGFAAFADVRQWLDGTIYKEYLTTCLDRNLDRDSVYVLDFYLGFMTPFLAQSSQSFYSFSPASISLFGHPSCTALPYGNATNSSYKTCPMSTDPQWVELAKMTITGTEGQWVRVKAEFKAPKAIGALVIGPSCEASPFGNASQWGFYGIDQILLYKKDDYVLPEVTRSGDICADTLTLTAHTNSPVLSNAWQWYKNDEALPGETNDQLLLTRKHYGAGDYRVRLNVNQKTYLSPEAIVTINDADFDLEDSVMICTNSNVLLQPKITPSNDHCTITYRWQDGSVGTTFNATAPGIYWFETEKNGCKKRDSVKVVASPSPVVSLGADTTLCSNNTLLLSAGNPGWQYQWQDSSSRPTLLVNAPGTYFVKAFNGSCAAADTIIVQYEKNPTINFSKDTILCAGEQKQLKPEVYGDKFLWNTGSTAPEITITQPGTYILQAENNCGSVSKPVNIVTGACEFYLPSAFTPNRDGLNDVFRLTYYGFIKKFDFKIFNRWGQVVYASSDPSKGWNGMLNGRESPTGVYVWTIKYTDWNGQVFLKKGTVSLIR